MPEADTSSEYTIAGGSWISGRYSNQADRDLWTADCNQNQVEKLLQRTSRYLGNSGLAPIKGLGRGYGIGPRVGEICPGYLFSTTRSGSCLASDLSIKIPNGVGTKWGKK